MTPLRDELKMFLVFIQASERHKIYLRLPGHPRLGIHYQEKALSLEESLELVDEYLTVLDDLHAESVRHYYATQDKKTKGP